MSGPDTISAEDVGKRAKLIEGLVADNVPEAFNAFIDFARDFGSREAVQDAILIKQENSEINRHFRNEEIPFAEYMTAKRKNNRKLLEWVHEIRSAPQLKVLA